MNSKRFHAVAVLFYLCYCQAGVAQLAPAPPSLPDFDKRLDVAPKAQVLDAQRAAAAALLKAQAPAVKIDLDSILAAPKFIINADGFLSGPDSGQAPPPVPGQAVPPLPVNQALPPDPYRQLRKFLKVNSALFGHGDEVLAPARVTREFVTAHNGMRTTVWEQQLDGIPVFGAVLIGHVSQRGELVCLSSQFLPNVEQAANMAAVDRAALELAPPFSAQIAVFNAATNIGEQVQLQSLVPIGPLPTGPEQKQRFAASPWFNEAQTELVWLPMNRGSLRLCWRVTLDQRSRGETYQALIDAQTGEPLVRHCMTVYLSNVSYRVFTSDSPSPFSPGWSTPNAGQPALGSRVLVTTNAVSTNASPNGWINDGATNTVGNNVDARLNTNANNNLGYNDPSVYPPRPSSTNRVYDFPLELTNGPSAYQSAAVVQLFYWCNWMHDKLYDLGFTEAAGNFQQDNFGRGGINNGNDAMLADAQFGFGIAVTDHGPRNNASYTHKADGSAGEIKMFIFDGPTPNRDGDLDTEIILHEYTHGLSNRRVGGGNGGAGLRAVQSQGMGEGWSDFYSLALLSEAGDDINGNYAHAGYSSYLLFGLTQNYYYGSRSYPYSTDMSKNPLTFKDFDANQASSHPGIPVNPNYSASKVGDVHHLGEVWCVTLWDARANFINKMAYTDGNQLILRTVTDAMNLTPPNPNFLQARDAILLADRVDNQGTNQNELWQAFAKRGMGYSAVAPMSDKTYGILEAFDLPPASPWLWTFQAATAIYSSPAIGADGTIYIGATNGHLYALNPNGTKKWEYPTGTSHPGFNSSPTVGMDQTIYVGADDFSLYALNPDGTLQHNLSLDAAVRSSPSLGSDGTIYVGSMGGSVYAYNSTGIPKGSPWPFVTQGAVYSSPAIGTNGTIYVASTGGRLYAIAPSGSLIWTFPSTGSVGAIYSSPAQGSDGTIYIGSDDGKLYAINPDGTQKWAANIGSAIRSSAALLTLYNPNANPTAVDNTVYVGAHDGNLYALDVATGSTKWHYLTGGVIDSSPLIGWDGTIYVGSADGNIYALNPDGSQRWVQSTGGAIVSSPVLGENGVLYFGSLNSYAYAIRAETIPGRLAWAMFKQNVRHTGNSTRLQLRFLGFVGNQAIFEFSGNSAYSVSIQYTDEVAPPGSYPTWNTLPNYANVYLQNYPPRTFADYIPPVKRAYRAVAGNPLVVVSFNVVGLQTLTVPTNGYAMIANQFNNPLGNTVGALIRSVPDGSLVWKFNEATQYYYDANTFVAGYGVWTAPNMTLNPGEGVIFQNISSTPATFTFAGDVLQGSLTEAVSSVLQIRSSLAPQAALLQTQLKYPALSGDVIYRMNNPYQTYTGYTNSSGTWLSPNGQPTVNVGESFWISTATARNWIMSFLVGPFTSGR